MHIYIFNAALLVAWLLVLVGGVLLNLGAGLIAAGVMLLVLVSWSIRLGGGVYAPTRSQKGEG